MIDPDCLPWDQSATMLDLEGRADHRDDPRLRDAFRTLQAVRADERTSVADEAGAPLRARDALWKSKPDAFISRPCHHMLGPNT